jgi:hypothetical protein
VALIDVSEPTENLIWEIEELRTRTRTKCVYICEHRRAEEITSSSSQPIEEQLARLLELDEILAYITDRRGRRRFARALRGKLLSISSKATA